MHTDWWICTGIPRPVLGKDGLAAPAAWERAPLARKPLTSLIFCPISEYHAAVDIMLVLGTCYIFFSSERQPCLRVPQCYGNWRLAIAWFALLFVLVV